MSLDREDVKHEHTIAEGMKVALTDIKNTIENPDEVIGVPTGLTEFRRIAWRLPSRGFNNYWRSACNGKDSGDAQYGVKFW